LAEIGGRIGFVTYDGARDLTEDDRLAVDPLRGLGYVVEPVIWDDPTVDWKRYRGLILRSTWNYHKKSTAFSAWLVRVEQAGCSLWNPPALVRWNMDKTYLKELSETGIPITPTVWFNQGGPADLVSLLEKNGWGRAVVKPTLSATAHLTWITTPDSAAQDQVKLDQMVGQGGVLVQKFEDVIKQGEWSLIFLGGRFSHSVLKVPAKGDFRVQKEFGGTSAPAVASDRVIVAAERVLAQVRFPWLYARVDLVDADNEVRLMELEMLEPDLFLRHDSGAPERFAKAIKVLL
jgi:glutathione synthase/RimK-type ligase-like ATP-grasp enzyme